MKYWVNIDDVEHEIDIQLSGDTVRVSLDGSAVDADVKRVPGGVSFILNGEVFDIVASDDPAAMTLAVGGIRKTVQVENERERGRRQRKQASGGSQNELNASMPGRIVKILVEIGQTIAEGDALVVIEAMKMENELRAAGPATVKTICVSEGDTVENGAALMTFEPVSE
jgi:biotin carboxyl carrier protein